MLQATVCKFESEISVEDILKLRCQSLIEYQA